MSFTERPVLAFMRAVGLMFVTLILVQFVRGWSEPGPLDFVSFWAAAKLALAGDPAAAWDMAAHRAAQGPSAPPDGQLPFAYPPPFLLLLLPFGFLGYGPSLALWVATTFPAFLAAARGLLANRRQLWIAVAFPPMLVNGVVGQTGFLTAALFVGGLVLVDRRPFMAGMLIGGLVIKPHLAVLIPFALLAGGHWRVIAGAALSSAGLLLAALLAFGLDAYSGFFAGLPAFGRIAAEGLTGWHKLASAYALLRSVGAPAPLAWAGHIALAAGAAAIAIAAWRRNSPARAPLLAVAAATVPPYLYAYDLLFLILPFAAILKAGFAAGRLPAWRTVTLALIWLLPLAQLVMPIALTALVAPALLLLILVGRSRPEPVSSPSTT